MADQQRSAGSAYLVAPPSQEGPGVLLLHSWWGLTDFFRQTADRLADAGFVTLVPDLFGDGRIPRNEADAQRLLHDADMNRMADLVLSSTAALRATAVTPDGPVGVMGFSMGASLALWLAARSPAQVGAAVAFYGTQSIDLGPVRGAVQCHFAEDDAFIDDDERVEMEAHFHLIDAETEVHRYPGTTHWFFEADQASYEPDAANLAWDRSVAFLHRHLDPTEAGHEAS
jgi:carboxymethylenebutenolidase